MSVAKSQLPAIKAKIQANAIKPYPHQELAIANGLQEFKKANRATVVMPCGTGKTLVCLWIAEKIQAKTVVVFVPSLALIHQTALEWAKATSKSLKLMAICSDLTVALDEDGIIVDKDEFWFPVLSAPTEISAFLQEPVNNKEIKVVFCTYQSSFTLAEAMGDFKFSLGIFDEAHRTAVRGESYFSAPLFDEYVAIDKRLFVTATPKQYALVKKDEQDDFVSVLSMDNAEHYGRHCHVLSFRKAIEQGIISDYKIVFPEVTSDMVAREMQIRENTDLPDNAVYNAAMQIVLRKAIEKTNASKIITFHNRVNDAEQFTNSLRNNKVIPGCYVTHVNGKQSSATRKTIMLEFGSKVKSLISNARCLTEGIDAPSVDMVALFSNKKSKIDIIQAIGRALRKYPGKQCGYIMVPIFVDTAAGETYEEALAKPEAQVLFELLLALEQHDELLCEAIRGCRFNEGYKGEKSFALLDRFFDAASRKQLSSDKFQQALSIAIVYRLGSNWDKMVGHLVKFKEQHAHCLVPYRFKEDPAFGRWVSRIRLEKRKGKLSIEKIQELDVLGFDWDPIDTVWQQRVTELGEFKQRHGHYLVPQGFKENQLLARWVNTTRVSRQKGTLASEKINELDNLGFDWEPLNTIWNERIRELKAFKLQYGHYLVPQKFKDAPYLPSWVSNTRIAKKQGLLTEEKINELQALQFPWEVHNTMWQQRVAELKEFKKQYGHCLVLREFKENKTLARWVHMARVLRRKGTLASEKINELEALGFVWEPYDAVWQQRRNCHSKCVNSRNQVS